ncbi:hypothetical protein [uncultured Parasutterella sp.]|uniref:hypothetical protein n=1 Tax=uncultured Parasutterella sp. TaxID=1263098 RepID=UPI00259342B8|nr:hypothetical protein [uncultured Parasutterella sp.]
MKYEYRFKNKELGEACFTIFGREFVLDEIEQQIPDEEDFINLECDEWDANNKLFNAHIEFSKEEIEKALVYDSDDWNLYPEVEPPEEGKYLVTVRLLNGEVKTEMDWYYSADDCWANNSSDEILAFMSVPTPYKPEKSE